MSDILRENCDLESIDNEVVEEEINLGEGKDPVKKKSYYIVGPYIQAEKKNHNKRIYPKPVLESQLNVYSERIKQNRAMGELGHPATTEINLDRVSHLIKELKMEENMGIGKSLIMETPMGNIAKALIESGVKLGVSSRGVGSLKNGVVQNDFRLITVDIVADPSAPDAFVDGILESRTEWVLENDILVQKDIEELKEDLDKFSREDITTATKKVFGEFLKKVRENL